MSADENIKPTHNVIKASITFVCGHLMHDVFLMSDSTGVDRDDKHLKHLLTFLPYLKKKKTK